MKLGGKLLQKEVREIKPWCSRKNRLMCRICGTEVN